MLEPLLAMNGIANVLMALGIDELPETVAFRETLDCSLTMLPRAPPLSAVTPT